MTRHESPRPLLKNPESFLEFGSSVFKASNLKKKLDRVRREPTAPGHGTTTCAQMSSTAIPCERSYMNSLFLFCFLISLLMLCFLKYPDGSTASVSAGVGKQFKIPVIFLLYLSPMGL